MYNFKYKSYGVKLINHGGVIGYKIYRHLGFTRRKSTGGTFGEKVFPLKNQPLLAEEKTLNENGHIWENVHAGDILEDTLLSPAQQKSVDDLILIMMISTDALEKTLAEYILEQHRKTKYFSDKPLSGNKKIKKTKSKMKKSRSKKKTGKSKRKRK
jgi:hypothetical protein